MMDVPADLRLMLSYDASPVERPASDIASALAGVGNVRVAGPPIEIEARLIDVVSGAPGPLSRVVTNNPVSVRLPVAARPPDADTQFAWLVEERDNGRFVGYRRITGAAQWPSELQVLAVPLSSLQGTLFQPVFVAPAYVETLEADVRLWSSSSASANAAELAVPQFTRFRVIGPELRQRLPVLNVSTNESGWIDVDRVGFVGLTP
jgi:hypothetical protein